MSIRLGRLCHHCAYPLDEDEGAHYVFECHACVIADYDLAAAVRSDPDHPDAERLSGGPVDTTSLRRSSRKTRPALRVIAGAKAA